ncbi:MAG: hypothetical protein AB1798_14000 [Spirochaetota bacterium]
MKWGDVIGWRAKAGDRVEEGRSILEITCRLNDCRGDSHCHGVETGMMSMRSGAYGD